MDLSTEQEMKRAIAGIAEQANELAVKFFAVAEPSRLIILYTLFSTQRNLDDDHISQDVLNVDDLSTVMGMPQPTVSHHLKLLRYAKLVGCKSVGLNNYYYVRTADMRALAAALLGMITEPNDQASILSAVNVKGNVANLVDALVETFDRRTLKALVEALTDLL